MIYRKKVTIGFFGICLLPITQEAMVPGGRFELPTRGFQSAALPPELPGHAFVNTLSYAICPSSNYLVITALKGFYLSRSNSNIPPVVQPQIFVFALSLEKTMQFFLKSFCFIFVGQGKKSTIIFSPYA